MPPAFILNSFRGGRGFRGAALVSTFAIILPLLLLNQLASSAEQAADLPPHPRLLLNAEGVASLKARIASAPWAKASWDELQRSAENSLEQAIVLPPRGGNWSHNYVCPTHGARLSQGKKLGEWQWEHICPVGHHVLLGDPSKANLDFDGNSIMGIHSEYAQEALNDGLVYQATGADQYAKKAREILLAYVERYLTYPLHDNQGRPDSGGHVASQSLTEASWLISMAQSMDLIWAALTEEDRQLIAEKLLRPALNEVILPRRMGVHNIQCRHNSAIGLVGLLLGDQKLVSIAIDDPTNGFRRQLERGVTDDGMWIEGSSGYHFFTIAGLWPLAEAARNCGINLYTDKFCQMFEGPLALAMPNLVLPNFNDSGTVPLRNEADLYELAWARFGKSEFLPLIKDSNRSGRLALLFGATNLPSASAGSLSSSRNLKASGYAILQQGNGVDATWLCVKYGPHGGGHGHPDKNSFILYSQGQIVAIDAGTHAYGSPLHRDWDKTTLAHNTLVMDETSQAPAGGISLAFGSESGIDYSMTDAGPIYPGVSFVRTVAMINSKLILFVDQVEANARHTFDLAYHQNGEWLEPLRDQKDVKPWLSPRLAGYVRLSQTVSRKIAGENRVLHTKVADQLQPSLVLAATGPTEAITGYGILKTTEDLAPVLIQRRETQRTAFIWAVALDGTAPRIDVTAVPDASGKILPLSKVALVKAATGKKEVSILVNPEEIPCQAVAGSQLRNQGRVSIE